MRIFVSSYACETGRGGEGEIGWRLVHALAKDHDVRVITRANLAPIHESAFAEHSKPEGLKFIYFDLPWIFRFYKRGNRFFLLYYYLWQIGVALKVRRIVRDEPADVLHHLVGGMDWMPSGLALCPGPFVWGPVGSENTHPVMLRNLPLKSRMKDKSRLVVRWVMRTLDPFTRLTGARAKIVLSHTPETLPRRYALKVRSFGQTGIVDLPTMARPKSTSAREGQLRLIYAGELKDWKGGRMALEAALRFFEDSSEGELLIFGDGPMRSEMESFVRQHPEGNRVTFRGHVAMDCLVEELHKGDIFLYPSFHHGLATIVLQAMLTSLAIICIEGDATGRVVGQEAGITVPLAFNRDPVLDLAKAISTLASDNEKLTQLGCRARQIAQERYSYSKMAESLTKTYQDILG